MKIEKKLRKLADSLVVVADSYSYLDGLYAEVLEFRNLLFSSPALRQLFISEELERTEKKKILSSVFEGRFSPVLVAGVYYLVDTRSEKKIFKFLHFLEHRIELALKKAQPVVVAAFELDDELKKIIEEAVKKKIGREAKIKYEVSPDIIGGLILKIGDELIDASVKGRLLRFKKSVSAQL